ALTTAYADAHGTDTCIVRLFNTYGPRMRGHDGRAVPTFVRQALDGEPLTVTGDGRQTRSLSFVDATVAGILGPAARGRRRRVNTGNRGELTMVERAGLAIELANWDAEIGFTERPVDDPAVRCADIARARDKLGWQPRAGAEEGLRRTIDWFRA